MSEAETPSFVPIDSNGNLESKNENGHVWTYEWNALNLLVRVTKDAAEVAAFNYDPIGRRVEKVAGGVTTSYTYDAEDILREMNGGTSYSYVHGPGIDEPMVKEYGGSVAYFHADGLGSIVKMTDSSGTVVQTRQYNTWGKLEIGADHPGYSFTGREWDPELGMYYYRARYYGVEVGRFLSEDPISDGLNFYAYVGSDPLNANDPFGLQAVPDTIPPIPLAPRPPGKVIPFTSPAPCPLFRIFSVAGILLMQSGDAAPGVSCKPDESNEACARRRGCKPCIPPVGTRVVRVDMPPSRPHRGVSAPHWKMYEMHQSPPPKCKCWWHPIPDNRGGFGPGTGPPGVPPMPGPAMGGGPL